MGQSVWQPLRGRKGMVLLRATLALPIALVVAAVASSAEPIRGESYVERNLIFDDEVQDLEPIEEQEQEDEDAMISNRAKRSPVFPTFDVVEAKIFKKSFKGSKKKFK